MATPRPLHHVRWRLVVPVAATFVLLGLAAVAAQTRYSLLSQGGKRTAWITLLSSAWWLEQAFFWSVAAATLVWPAVLARHAAATRTANPIHPDRVRAWRHRWLSAAITLVLLQLAGAADLWLAEQPASPPRHLSAPAPNQFRIAAIGGSAAAGYPYERRHAFPALVGWRLQRLFPDREVVVENLAQRGYTLEGACRDLNKLEALPRVLLIYSGHNEFLMRYRLDGTPDERLRFQPSFLARALERRIDALRQPPEAVDNLQLRDVERPLFDRPVASAAEWAMRRRNFRNHLEATVRWCRDQGVLPILIIPAVNESGFEPCRSYLPLGFPDDKQRRLREFYTKIERGSDVESLAEARDLCPTFAMTWFLLARAYENNGQYDQARHAYQQALSHDGFPWHATPFADTCRDVAAKYDVPLLDARDILRPLAPHGILNDHLFHDVLHPSLAAHLAIADAVISELRRRSLPVPAQQWPADLRPDPGRLADYLQLTPELWARVCDQVAKAQLGVPPPHFDAQRRQDRARLYSRAAARLRAEADSKSISVPGIGYDGFGRANDNG